MFYATGLAPSWSPTNNGKNQTAKMCRMLVSRCAAGEHKSILKQPYVRNVAMDKPDVFSR
jgi:hypothetical protein